MQRKLAAVKREPPSEACGAPNGYLSLKVRGTPQVDARNTACVRN